MMEVRIADRHDIEGMVELQKHVYYEKNRDNPFFAWQCFENVNPSILVVAQQDTSIVGTFGIQKRKTTGGLYGGQLSWLIVAEHTRRNRLFTKMGNLALESISGLDFIFVIANKNAVLPCEKSFDMKFIGELPQMVLADNQTDMCAESSVEQINNETVFDKLPSGGNVITFLRTERYRRWRYASSTVHTYFKVSIPSGEYAIIKLFNPNQSSEMIGDIVDFECDLMDTCKLEHLFRAASFELKQMGAVTIMTWAMPGSELRCSLENMGFTKSEYDSYLGVKMLNETYIQLGNLNNWHLVQSDASNY